MAKHPTSSRVQRGDQAPDDAFVASIKRVYAWGHENRRTVTVALAVIVALALGTIWYFAQKRQTEQQATTRLNEVQQTLASGNVQLAIRDLQTYLDRFGATRAADQARLLLAGVLLDQDRPQEAVEALGSLPRETDEPLGLAGARLQAAALEEAGDIDGAVDTYLRIASRARFPFERREALADAARIRLQNGQSEEAADLYERVLGTFGDEEQGRSYYEMWLAEARAQAREGAGTTPTVQDTAAAAEAGASEG